MPLKCETAMLQDRLEMQQLCKIVREENVRSFLEIGSKHGGSVWEIAKSVKPGGRIVSVDLPHGDRSFKESEPHLTLCIAKLRELGYDAYLLIGDSTDPQVIEDVRRLGPFDFCFIDANHTEPYVRSDWKNYGALARIVALHDIAWLPRPEPSKKMPIEVPKVWNEIKHLYPHREIKLCPRDNGIGVLWRS